MLDLATPKGRIIDAALKLAAAKPWHDVTLHEIAQAAGVGLVDLSKEFYGKLSIMAAFTKLVDRKYWDAPAWCTAPTRAIATACSMSS